MSMSHVAQCVTLTKRPHSEVFFKSTCAEGQNVRLLYLIAVLGLVTDQLVTARLQITVYGLVTASRRHVTHLLSQSHM